MNPSFNFILGKPTGDGVGRWVEGAVTSAGAGYAFTANLFVRHSDAMLQCHRVQLPVERPFRAEDFAAYLTSVSTGEFQTASPVLGLYETDELDPASAAAIFDATSIWVDPCDHECLPLLKDLVSLGDQIQQLSERQRLSRAMATWGGLTWTPVRDAASSAEDGEGT